jgi:predicted alpha/beta superfamily hydrolase
MVKPNPPSCIMNLVITLLVHVLFVWSAADAYTDSRPLLPPFPNGLCGGNVVALPRDELYSTKSSPFNLFSSFENIILPPRDVKVWMPAEYHKPEFRTHQFPVLYCHDGQNAMEDADSWTGSSWRLVGALTRMYERDMLRIEAPPIVVLIPCGEGDFAPGISRRHAEYGDLPHPVSQAHGEFMATKLHPYIMNRFRVNEGPEHTAALGSSLGGQASLQLILRYPNVFGAAACLSPCFQAGTIAAVASKSISPSERDDLRSKTIYIDNGGDVDDTRVPVIDVLDHFTLNDKWWNPG